MTKSKERNLILRGIGLSKVSNSRLGIWAHTENSSSADNSFGIHTKNEYTGKAFSHNRAQQSRQLCKPVGRCIKLTRSRIPKIIAIFLRGPDNFYFSEGLT